MELIADLQTKLKFGYQSDDCSIIDYNVTYPKYKQEYHRPTMSASNCILAP